MKMLLVFGCLLGLASCARDTPTLEVSKFHLRQSRAYDWDTGLLRAEQRYRLHGAVSAEEQRDREGQYYTVRYDLTQWPEVTKPELVMRYWQAATASKELVKSVGLSNRSGSVEFAFVGEEFQRGGRVLAWKIELRDGGRVFESRQSAMWE